MNVAIAGFGLEGKASYDYWRAQGANLTIADERTELPDLPEDASTILGPDAFTKLGEFDLIVRAPGINPRKLPYGDKVWSATNEFFEQCPTSHIIGVTGTKGKGTTSSLIASILREAGKTVHLIGNIGTPALAELPNIGKDDMVVFELSSFQLWDLRRSPHVAVVLMIEPDHLDVHDDLADYLEAKGVITKFQQPDDVVIYNGDDVHSSAIAQAAAGAKLPYTSAVQLNDGAFYVGSDKVAPADALSLPGAHNVQNACAAILAAWHYTQDATAIERGLRAFDGLPHRLKFVAEKHGVKFYDDSIATTPGSAMAALQSFEQPKVLILGGSDKGADYTELIERCDQTRTKVIAIGQTGDDIVELCSQLGVVCERVDGDMAAIVARADEVAKPGEVVILSPAAASFDMFRNYADRGDQFAIAVNSLRD